MPLDPQIQKMLDSLKGSPSMEAMSLQDLRKSMLVVPPALRTAVGAVKDLSIPVDLHQVPARLYTPTVLTRSGLTIFFHGGGFVMGNLETHDHVCRDLCSQTESLVLSVDYRLAPEHKFPAATDDCFQVVCWAAENAKLLNIDRTRIVLAGDSAGATLALVTAMRLRDEGYHPARAQVLIYPVTDYHTPATPSYLENGEGYVLTRAAMIRFWDDYLTNPQQASHPYATPLRVVDLAAMPQALILTAEFDPLRDEGALFVERLRSAGVSVTHRSYDGLIHGFFRMSLVSSRAKQAVAETAQWISQVMC
jgi:acetyl esterase